MRRFAVVTPRIWRGISKTGRALREAGPHAMLIALYLITNPRANMLGLYDLPHTHLSHDTGLSEAEALAALEAVCATGFAEYSADEGIVWIPGMACLQIAPSLSARDHRRTWVARELAKFQGSQFHAKFLERYGTAYGLAEVSTPHDNPPQPPGREVTSAAEMDRLLGESDAN